MAADEEISLNCNCNFFSLLEANPPSHTAIPSHAQAIIFDLETLQIYIQNFTLYFLCSE